MKAIVVVLVCYFVLQTNDIYHVKHCTSVTGHGFEYR